MVVPSKIRSIYCPVSGIDCLVYSSELDRSLRILILDQFHYIDIIRTTRKRASYSIECKNRTHSVAIHYTSLFRNELSCVLH